MKIIDDLIAYRRVALLALAVVVLMVVAGGLHLLTLEHQLVEDIAIKDAEQYSNVLKEFRTLYTSEVVGRARAHGMTVSHDYVNTDGAIPLPATLSMMFGNRMALSSGVTSSLYSDYPFPWRREEGGPRDDFQWQALRSLRDNPSQSFSKFEMLSGQPVVRYATADLMRPSCVTCHNNHPDSPKTDWRVGDVRGVLEVVRPVSPRDAGTRSTLRNLVGLIAVLVVLGVSALILLASRLRRESLVSAELAADAIRINRDLKLESTERAKAEAQSREFEAQVHHAQKLESIGLLAGGIAHDFNNLLAAVSGNAELAKATLPENSEAMPKIVKIEKATIRAKQLTNQLLAYAGRGQFRRMLVNLTVLLREIEQLLETMVPSGVTASYELSDGLPPVIGDTAQLQQVAMNLITNAAEACQATNGSIRVSTGSRDLSQDFLDQAMLSTNCMPGSYVYLKVEDNGPGIAPDDIQKVFEPFYSTKAEGRGLGLAALQGILRSHQGALTVDSTPGSGTCFVALFPEAIGEAETAPEASRAADAFEQTILLIDDDDEVRETVASLLRASGCIVVEAANGEQGLDAFSTRKPPVDMVVIDWQMPGMGGAATLEALLALSPGLRVLICSGYGNDQDIEQLLVAGQVLFLQKPFTLNELLASLEAIRPE